jgi:molybdenum cofactor synthesis domain-containing protein
MVLTPDPAAEPLRGASATAALAAWAEACAAAGCAERTPSESVSVALAVGRVTAQAVVARRSSPALDCAAMDGIAVSAADTTGRIVTDYVVVDTGDPMPDGYDAVVMREYVRYGDLGAGGPAELDEEVTPGRHVRPAGEDIRAGAVLLPAGHLLRPMDVAAAAAAGHTELTVRQKPVVVIIPTGDEIRPIGSELARGEILDTNSLMLAAQATELGCDARITAIVPDDPELLRAALRSAAGDAHLVVLIAGSSAGRDDYTAEVVQKAGTLAVHEVAVRPGHPVVLGVAYGVPVLGAPGYPVSAALTFEIFAAPLLATRQGTSPARRPVVTARLDQDIRSSEGSDDWIRVRLTPSEDGGLIATPLPRRAGVLTSLVRADGLMVIPAGVTGLVGGAEVEVRLLGGYASVESGARTR